VGNSKQIETEELVEFKTKDKLLESFLEDWNERNPEHKLDTDTINLFAAYLRVAYVGGWDDHRILVDKFLNGPGLSVNKHFFMKWLNELEEKV